MSPAFVLEPTYRRLKLSLMEGLWIPGAKLEAQKLADEFGVSMTPVRDSLNQLVGEGLVAFAPGEGFRVASLCEQALRDLLSANLAVLDFALRTSDDQEPRESSGDPASSDAYASRIAAVFAGFARGSGNRVIESIIGQINDRLHCVRRLEPSVLSDAGQILKGLEDSIRFDRHARLEAAKSYHETCLAHVPPLIAALHR